MNVHIDLVEEWLPHICPKCGCQDRWIDTLSYFVDEETDMRYETYRCANWIKAEDGFADQCDYRLDVKRV